VKYLLDVIALIALVRLDHAMHDRVAHWIQAETLPVTLTCSITELGFVRMLSNASAYGFTVAPTQSLLKQLKASPVDTFALIGDQNAPLFCLTG